MEMKFDRIIPYKGGNIDMTETFSDYIIESIVEAFTEYLTPEEIELLELQIQAKQEEERIRQENIDRVNEEIKTLKRELAELELISKDYSEDQEEPTEEDRKIFRNKMAELSKEELEEFKEFDKLLAIGIEEYIKTLCKQIAYSVCMSYVLKYSLLAKYKASRRIFPKQTLYDTQRKIDYCLVKEINTHWRAVA